jgi:hypothetical protein
MLADESLSAAYDRLTGSMSTSQRIAYNKEVNHAIAQGIDAAQKTCRVSGPSRELAEMNLQTMNEYSIGLEVQDPGRYIRVKMTPETRAILAVDAMTEKDKRLLDWTFLFMWLANYHKGMAACH